VLQILLKHGLLPYDNWFEGYVAIRTIWILAYRFLDEEYNLSGYSLTQAYIYVYLM